MNKIMLACLVVPGFLAAAEEPVCKKCQMIREYNAAHPENNYFYYDDYVKEKGKKSPTDEPTASTDKEKDGKKQK